ncbi:MAG: hypothetical protein O9327_21920 [Polaromonas sp.]|nr:hypothetical protein [Polaromonas sp.]
MTGAKLQANDIVLDAGHLERQQPFRALSKFLPTGLVAINTSLLNSVHI